MNKQVPGKTYTFRNRKTGEEDTGILPESRGESNDFAWWQKKKQSKFGGHWSSKLFSRIRSSVWRLSDKSKVYRTDWENNNREYKSVVSHYGYIFNIRSKAYKSYKGMPFYDAWNPKKGGSYRTGANWIITNLGKRPKGSSLHIIEHEVGFIPGNLEWTYPRKQINQQMFKIIAQQRHRIKELEKELMEVKIKLDNVNCSC